MNARRDRVLRRLRAAVVVAALPLASACFGPTRGPAPLPPEIERPPAADNAGRAASPVLPPVIPLPEPPAPEISPGIAAADNEAGRTTPGEETAARPEEREIAAAPAAPARPGEETARGPETPAPPRQGAAARQPSAPGPAENGEKRRAAPPPRPEREAAAREAAEPGPPWARRNEVLSYRVDFIGITMGYARFSYMGRVSIGGKIAYHLKVRAWTSGVLSYIYPVNETIDYYLDAETVAPIRQEFTARAKDRDDVAIYDQKTGEITYRYLDSGEVKKQVKTVPDVYDPVSAVYYFRWKDIGGDEAPRNVYAGRKLWQISARLLGTERLHTEFGPMDTLVIQPVIRRDGKLENKGDLKMWVSDDERRVPVRLYAKFHKIKDWTLVGELLPAQKKGGVGGGQGAS